MNKRIALVTGGNRGIGFEICRQLAKQNFLVLLAARTKANAKEAVKLLPQGSIQPIMMDVSSDASVADAAQEVAVKYGRLDVLINNAGIMPGKSDSKTVQIDYIKRGFATNLYGPLRTSQQFLSLLKKGTDARIINMSSGMGALHDMGGGYTAYRLSKTALNALTRTMAEDLSADEIKVFTMCPGWVKTDMGGNDAPRTVEQGADTAVWLATDSAPVSGLFYRDREVIEW